MTPTVRDQSDENWKGKKIGRGRGGKGEEETRERERGPGEEETTSHVNEATDWSCVLRTSGLLPVAEHFVDVLQAQ